MHPYPVVESPGSRSATRDQKTSTRTSNLFSSIILIRPSPNSTRSQATHCTQPYQSNVIVHVPIRTESIQFSFPHVRYLNSKLKLKPLSPSSVLQHDTIRRSSRCPVLHLSSVRFRKTHTSRKTYEISIRTCTPPTPRIHHCPFRRREGRTSPRFFSSCTSSSGIIVQSV